MTRRPAQILRHAQTQPSEHFEVCWRSARCKSAFVVQRSADVPNESKFVQSLYALLRNAGLPLPLSLSIHPSSEPEAALNLTIRNAAMPLARFVSF